MPQTVVYQLALTSRDPGLLETGEVVQYRRAVFDPSGRRVVLAGVDARDEERLYVQDVASGPPRAFTPPGVTLAPTGRPVSPDGQRVVALGPDGLPALYPLEGGEPRALPGLGETDVVLCWTPRGDELFVARYDTTPPRIERVEVATGRSRPWRTGRSAPSGLLGQYRMLITPDGQSYAYSHARSLGDLYISSPLRRGNEYGPGDGRADIP